MMDYIIASHPTLVGGGGGWWRVKLPRTSCSWNKYKLLLWGPIGLHVASHPGGERGGSKTPLVLHTLGMNISFCCGGPLACFKYLYIILEC